MRVLQLIHAFPIKEEGITKTETCQNFYSNFIKRFDNMQVQIFVVLSELNHLEDYNYLTANLSLVVSDGTSTDKTTKHECYFRVCLFSKRLSYLLPILRGEKCDLNHFLPL